MYAHAAMFPSRSLGKFSIPPSIRLGRSFQYPLLESRTTLCTACIVNLRALCARDAANLVPPAFAGKNVRRRSSLFFCFTSFVALSQLSKYHPTILRRYSLTKDFFLNKCIPHVERSRTKLSNQNRPCSFLIARSQFFFPSVCPCIYMYVCLYVCTCTFGCSCVCTLIHWAHSAPGQLLF